MLPDTQYLFDADSSDPAPVRATLDYLLARRGADNIAFLAQLGDLTEHGSAGEMAQVSATFEAVDSRLPFSVVAGNHDVDQTTDDRRGLTPYLERFGPERYRQDPTYLGASPDGYNTAHRITAADRRWLILALDWRSSDRALGWARATLAANPTVPAIVTTHDIAFSDEDGRAFLSRNGRRLWDLLIREHDQIFLTLSGHDWPPGRNVLRNAAGHDVHIHTVNYQERYYGGAGMVRLYHFDLDRNRIDVETFAPWLLGKPDRTPLEAETAELTGDHDRFSVAVDFARRFAAFDPVPAPAPRVAAQVVDRHTAAYWRFDSPGAVIRDQSGNGNDLSIRRGSPKPSADHHLAAPGHASLYFDGGGAHLTTGAGAPLNAATFRDGYTIEIFAKLPSPFVGVHDWMGLLSWEGTTPDPPCSLDLAPEFFLRYATRTGTSWSHALPTGVWMHVAVVNDGGRTVIWIDGSRIARNPRRPAPGLLTDGRPFLLGATVSGPVHRGFYGWLGDVRITGRALAPADFLPAGRYR
ncbi:LamG-like jellyroll fold domain-containing protein [Paractinoplanes rishiriensis]|uniref:Calcineurin-like phosphoesterase domain-containing protein n=1 Tax=Paractinoplanes rishiriensis TaxID=1050105 RepID=A0A919JX89_9ACTN|nr:LamG-like jellyroll fold domain-containing protein [Actinoplanes rishiriensis]GIE94977.1 hypothetical protein Ari01nite_24420 [Actinoplanes rishiriensis]